MTPAIDLLKKKQIAFNIHQYEHDTNNTNFGEEAVQKLAPSLAITADRVFKTLVVIDATNPKVIAVAVLPVNKQLDLKKVAKALQIKKIELSPIDLAQKTTGYLVGGISPLGQKKQLKTLIHSSAQELSTLFISGGRRGLEIEIEPEILRFLLNAQMTDIC